MSMMMRRGRRPRRAPGAAEHVLAHLCARLAFLLLLALLPVSSAEAMALGVSARQVAQPPVSAEQPEPLASSRLGTLAFRWAPELSRAEPYEASAFHGETFRLKATPRQYGQPLTGLSDATAKLYWQTPGMEPTQWYTAPGEYDPATGTLTATWTPAMDVGGDRVTFFLALTQGDAVAYRIHGRLRLKPSPGFNPATLVPEDVRQELVDAITADVKGWANATYQPKGDYLTAEADPTVPAWAKAPAKPTYAWAEIQGRPTSWAWEAITGKPVAFPPAAHTHTLADVTALQATLDAKADVEGGVLFDPQLLYRAQATAAPYESNGVFYGHYGPFSMLGCEGAYVVPKTIGIRRRSGATFPGGDTSLYLRVLRAVNGAWVVAYQSDNAVRLMDTAAEGAPIGPWEMRPVGAVSPIPATEPVAIVATASKDAAPYDCVQFGAKSSAYAQGGLSGPIGQNPATHPIVAFTISFDIGYSVIRDFADYLPLTGGTVNGPLRMTLPAVADDPDDPSKDIVFVPTTNGEHLQVQFPSGKTMLVRGNVGGSLATVGELNAVGNQIVDQVNTALGGYLPLTGGTLTGNVTFSGASNYMEKLEFGGSAGNAGLMTRGISGRNYSNAPGGTKDSLFLNYDGSTIPHSTYWKYKNDGSRGVFVCGGAPDGLVVRRIDLETILKGYSKSTHTHTAAQITEADPTVPAWAKAAAKPTYAWAEIQGRPTSWAWEAITGKPAAFPPAAHTHALADVTGLTAALSQKANATHTHVAADITNLSATLNPLYAAKSHAHPIAEVDGLQAELNGKSPVGHGHAMVDVEGLTDALGGYLPLTGGTVNGHLVAFNQSVSDTLRVRGVDIRATLEKKQNKLIAGDNVTLETQTDGTVKISSAGGGDSPEGTAHWGSSSYGASFGYTGGSGISISGSYSTGGIDGTFQLAFNGTNPETGTAGVVALDVPTKGYVDEAVASAGGGAYTLPAATASTLGGVKVGGNESGIAIRADGTLEIPIGDGLTIDRRGLSATMYLDDNGGLLDEGMGVGLAPLAPVETNTIAWEQRSKNTRISMLRVTPDASDWVGFITERWPEGAKLFVRLTTPAAFTLPDFVKVLGYFDLEPSSTYQLEAWVVAGTMYLSPILKEEP